MFEAIAWDVDGTLVDSEPLHHVALMAVSRRYGVTVKPDDDRFVGVAMGDVWRVLSKEYPSGLTRDVWLEEIVEAYIEHAPRLKPIPGACEAVAAFHKAGVAQCCVSNSARRIVETNLAAVGLDGMVLFSVVREDVEEGKPDPAPYALACARLGKRPDSVMAIEDSAVGAESARRAGLSVLQFGLDFDDFSSIALTISETRVSA
ncbi:HAD family hydrolase [Roseibium aggregatum]|uniref:Phosphorylated carbohydrates phosphatase n=1 Tax=Roseibium aggregatum TaxID=187304 RepID=A0A0M6YEJ2_9HYPH|nr:HAD family phosphatase [Roseibium aggregatum]CTQ47431.1 Phosphorylated carbohydrates phosphatase [Roseibium aggregatum]